MTPTTLTASMLTLGTRGDALEWRAGCSRLGMTILPHIREPRPSLTKLKELFVSTPDWIYFGGHFDSRGLMNDRAYDAKPAEAVVVAFLPDRVTAASHTESAALLKDRGQFCLHKRCKVTFWGGCNVASDVDTLSTVFRLFGPHLLIGFVGKTSHRLVSAVIGTKSEHGDFFGRLGSDPTKLDSAAIRDAWFDAVKASKDARGSFARYRIIDESGQEWRLKKKWGRFEVVKGRFIAI